MFNSKCSGDKIGNSHQSVVLVWNFSHAHPKSQLNKLWVSLDQGCQSSSPTSNKFDGKFVKTPPHLSEWVGGQFPTLNEIQNENPVSIGNIIQVSVITYSEFHTEK